LGPWTGSTSDLVLSVFDSTETLVATNSIWYEWPSTDDPRVFVNTAGTYYLVVESESASHGFYAINVRPRVVINEVDNREIGGNPYVELLGPPSFTLTAHELCTYDGAGVAVDPTEECVPLGSMTTDADGYLEIYWDDITSSALELPNGAGALVLQYLGSPLDSVQYGSFSGDAFAEGNTAEVGNQRTIGRGAGVDTNDNKMDFIYMASPTPGLPNDRTYQAAVPLYGEEAGK